MHHLHITTIGALYLAPINEEKAQSILDIGTGTGSCGPPPFYVMTIDTNYLLLVAIDLADSIPNAQVRLPAPQSGATSDGISRSSVVILVPSSRPGKRRIRPASALVI